MEHEKLLEKKNLISALLENELGLLKSPLSNGKLSELQILQMVSSSLIDTMLQVRRSTSLQPTFKFPLDLVPIASH